jgi:hypothetical protein
MTYRLETPAGAADSLGEIPALDGRFYGAQTARSLVQ